MDSHGQGKQTEFEIQQHHLFYRKSVAQFCKGEQAISSGVCWSRRNTKEKDWHFLPLPYTVTWNEQAEYCWLLTLQVAQHKDTEASLLDRAIGHPQQGVLDLSWQQPLSQWAWSQLVPLRRQGFCTDLDTCGRQHAQMERRLTDILGSLDRGLVLYPSIPQGYVSVTCGLRHSRTSQSFINQHWQHLDAWQITLCLAHWSQIPKTWFLIYMNLKAKREDKESIFHEQLDLFFHPNVWTIDQVILIWPLTVNQPPNIVIFKSLHVLQTILSKKRHF